MRDVIALILGGGRGTRLFPLTKTRSKPAVPLAGNYRLVDVTVSNCINSKIDRIYVLTQFNSASLNQHISKTYRFDTFSSGFVEVFAAEQTPSSVDWFQGTADAVRKVLPHAANHAPADILILSGDHLYRMDYVDFLARHRMLGSDITIAVKPVTANRAPELGILRADGKGRITEFREKPKGKLLGDMRTNTRTLGLSAAEAKRRPYLGSMGVYCFKFDVLREALERDPRLIDFAKEIIPDELARLKVHSYVFDGYWEDIGTIRTFYEAHMDLLSPLPPFNLFDERHPLYTHFRYLPGANMVAATVPEPAHEQPPSPAPLPSVRRPQNRSSERVCRRPAPCCCRRGSRTSSSTSPARASEVRPPALRGAGGRGHLPPAEYLPL